MKAVTVNLTDDAYNALRDWSLALDSERMGFKEVCRLRDRVLHNTPALVALAMAVEDHSKRGLRL